MNFSSGFNKYSSIESSNESINELLSSSDTVSSIKNTLSSTIPPYVPTWLGQSNINNNNSNICTSVSQYQYPNCNNFNQYNNNISGGTCNRNRYAPYQNRSYSVGSINIGNYPTMQPLAINQSFYGGSSSSNNSNYQYALPQTYGNNNYNKILTESSANFNNNNQNNNNYNNNNNNNNGNKKINSLSNCNNILSRNYQSFNTIQTSSTNTTTNQSQLNNNNNNLGSSSSISSSCSDLNHNNNGAVPSSVTNNNNNSDPNQPVTLQINNLDYSLEEQQLRSFLLNQLKPITLVMSLVFEGSSCAKVTVPDLYYAKQVVSNLHRKKIGHKRVVVSYTRAEIPTLRCQVAGLLKDVPYYTLPMYKFRELFQSRFKTSISVLDLYKMQDICSITTDKSDDKHISLNSELITSIENNPLMEGLQESVPYCTMHFQKEQHKGWAEQEIESLPNVFMTIAEMRQIICPLLKSHSGDIPVSSLIYCIAGELGIHVQPNDNGVNLEHLICCINGIQISNNNFGIKVLGWLEPENVIGKENNGDRYNRTGSPGDPLYQISKEVIELIKMSPKSTMKFNRFIPAYHNHFGKQCRVADYGCTKLIELFEALSSVVQIMGDGENRQITLTHRTQIRRFTTDLLRIIRSQVNKSILLSQLSEIFAQTQNRLFDITDYGVCAIQDILDGLANSNIIVITPIQNANDILISIPKRKQTIAEIEKTCVFAGEVVELLCNAPQYSIPFQKFVRSYHYHFGYQCRLSDYGFLKLADLMEAIQGVVEIELTSDEDKRIFLSPKIARRVFAEQLEELIKVNTGAPNTCMKLDEVLLFHKKKYGYQIQSQTLGFANIFDAFRELPYVEIIEVDNHLWIICHLNDINFRNQTYKICRIILNLEPNVISSEELLNVFVTNQNEVFKENTLMAMKHAVDIKTEKNSNSVALTRLMKYVMKVVKIIDQYKTSTLGEIKKYLNITLDDFFKIGYPNIVTFIRAHLDIFNFEVNSLIDRSKLTLVSSCPLLSNRLTNANIKTNSQELTIKQQEKKNLQFLSRHSSSQLLELYNKTEINDTLQTSNYYHINDSDISNNNNNDNFIRNYHESEKENQYSNGNDTQKLISTNSNGRYPPGITPSSAALINNTQQIYSAHHHHHHHHHQYSHQYPSFYGKDNSFNISLNSSNTSVDLNLSSINLNLNNNVNSLSLSDGSANSVTSSCDGINLSNDTNSTDLHNNDPLIDFPKLWTDGNIDYFNNNLNYSETEDIFGLLKTTNKTKNNDDKIDNNSDILPFWVDPIWGNDNKNKDLSHDQKNSTIKNPNKFDMPELQSINVIHPMLLNNSYKKLSESENMKNNMFSNDSNDEKLS